MSRTSHHNEPKKGRLLREADKYTGWLGEFCFRQNGRKHIKRREHRAARRSWRRQIDE